jgi:hypothetical protein
MAFLFSGIFSYRRYSVMTWRSQWRMADGGAAVHHLAAQRKMTS